ncbi:hypothetical protein [Pararhizobium sp. DWP3-4]|uniref:hypothetical protein n=1 Tax=Pararhizobium sp. DWP3-4 TaxID=2804565 RepID=UPI003CEAFC90
MGNILEIALPPERHLDPGSGVCCWVPYALCPPGAPKDQAVAIRFSVVALDIAESFYGQCSKGKRTVLLARTRRKNICLFLVPWRTRNMLCPKFRCR